MLLNQVLFIAGFFITPAVEKTKTQGKNSTSRSYPHQIEKARNVNHFFAKKSRGIPKNAICIKHIFLKMRILWLVFI